MMIGGYATMTRAFPHRVRQAKDPQTRGIGTFSRSANIVPNSVCRQADAEIREIALIDQAIAGHGSRRSAIAATYCA